MEKTKNELRKFFPVVLVERYVESYPTNKNCALNSVSAANLCMYGFTEQKRKKVWKSQEFLFYHSCSTMKKEKLGKGSWMK